MTQTVSILMLTCNNFAKVRKCVFSWLPAIRDDFVTELLILDNASTDGTVAWLKDFAARDGKIRVIYSKENLGCAGGRDVLFKQAAGDLLLSMDSDVLMVNRRAVTILAHELEDPRIGIVGDHGGGVRADWKWTAEAPKRYEGEAPIVTGYCQMFRRRALEHVALDLAYNPYWLEDSDFCFQLRAKLNQVGFIRHCGVKHVWNGTNSGGKPEQAKKWAYFQEKWQEQLGTSVVWSASKRRAVPPVIRQPGSPPVTKTHERNKRYRRRG